ncbi:MAG: NAD-dependent epimerase/dehydratase family protein [Bryobacteraceae bacterium]|nr:NAD-dependent epimerase/dehydratase family protein [Bryobacteraceae bacterium]
MKPTLVTGATGFVGWHVAKALLENGYRVRALTRAKSVPELDVETVTGDLRDPDSLARAVAGCGTLFHVAADYRLWARHPQELYESNVDGTRNLFAAAQRALVEKAVYTSTVGAIGMPPGALGDEDTPTRIEDMQGHYKRSKYQAELVALNFASSGFPVTIVNPTAPVGDHDFKPTPTGKIALDYLRGRMPAFVDTGLNLVDVNDVARGHIQALERGVQGERYILGGENMTLEAILAELAKITGRPAPKTKIPHWVAYAIGVGSTGLSALSGREPFVALDAVRMSAKKMWVTHSKAAAKLGYSPGDPRAALQRAVEWFRGNGYT